MWRLCKLGYRHEPRLMLAAFVLSLLAALPDALLALWLMLLGRGRARAAARRWCRAAAIGLGVSATATWFLRTVSTRVQRRFRDKVTIALESHVARLQASVATIAHHERPDYLDRLAMLRDQVFVLDHMYMSVFSTCGWILRLGVTVALLASIHPALVLLAVFALPTVLTSTWRPAVERAAQERAAQPQPAGAPPVHDGDDRAARQGGARHRASAPRLVAERREAWERGYAPVARGALGLGGLAHAGVGGLRRAPTSARSCSCRRVSARRRRRAAGARRRLAPVGLHRRDGRRDRVPARLLDGRLAAPRLARGLRRVARRVGRSAGARARSRAASASSTCRSPIPARRASCSTTCRCRCRPGRSSPSSARTAPARRRSSSCSRRCTSRSSGAILVDDTPLARMPADEWRARLAGAFQDFFRFEFRARHTVGLGDVPRLDDEPAVVDGGRARRRRRRRRAAAVGPRHAARPDVAGRRRGVVRPVAEARAGARLHARRAAAARARRADRRARRRDRARAVRALRRARARGAVADATAASRSSSRTASRPCAWPTSSSCSTARASSRSARTTS